MIGGLGQATGPAAAQPQAKPSPRLFYTRAGGFLGTEQHPQCQQQQLCASAPCSSAVQQCRATGGPWLPAGRWVWPCGPRANRSRVRSAGRGPPPPPLPPPAYHRAGRCAACQGCLPVSHTNLGPHRTAEAWSGFQFDIHQYMPGYGPRPLAGVPSTLTLTEAYKALGLPEGSSYDEVLSAKNRLLEGAGNNMERKMEVRAGDGRAKHRHPRQQRRVWCST